MMKPQLVRQAETSVSPNARMVCPSMVPRVSRPFLRGEGAVNPTVGLECPARPSLGQHTRGFWLNGGAPESNRASRGLHDLTGLNVSGCPRVVPRVCSL